MVYTKGGYGMVSCIDVGDASAYMKRYDVSELLKTISPVWVFCDPKAGVELFGGSLMTRWEIELV